MSFEIFDQCFGEILGKNPQLHCIAEGYKLTEGPVYLAQKNTEQGFFFFTDLKNDSIRFLRWNGLVPYQSLTALSYSLPSLFRCPAGMANGMTIDAQGRLIVAEAGGRRISITEHDGSISTLVDSYKGKKFNSPNDVIVKSDGTIWFTDPNYGGLGFGSLVTPENAELPNAVYCFNPKTQEITAVIETLISPNGLAFSCDEKILYVADSGACQGYDTYYENYPHHVYAYDVKDNTIKNERVFQEITPGFPDGLRVDIQENVYVAAQDGVQIFNSKAHLIGKILLPKAVTNFTFGGAGKNVLFICTVDSVWVLKLHIQGV